MLVCLSNLQAICPKVRVSLIRRNVYWTACKFRDGGCRFDVVIHKINVLDSNNIRGVNVSVGIKCVSPESGIWQLSSWDIVRS